MQVLSECNLAQIVVDLQQGKTFVFPTETSYGLGCDATNQESVDRIFEIKGRASDKPLLIVVPSIEEAKKYLVWNEILEKIAKKYLPGAVTVVGEYIGNIKHQTSNTELTNGVVAKDGTVAIRVTAHPLLKSITEKLGRPLVATSANVASEMPAYDAQKAIFSFQNRDVQPDIILDCGQIPVRPATTIVSVVGGVLQILRQGEQRVTI